MYWLCLICDNENKSIIKNTQEKKNIARNVETSMFWEQTVMMPIIITYLINILLLMIKLINYL